MLHLVTFRHNHNWVSVSSSSSQRVTTFGHPWPCSKRLTSEIQLQHVPLGAFLKWGTPNYHPRFWSWGILRKPTKVSFSLATQRTNEYLYTIPLVAWTLPWLKNMAGKCVFAVPRCPSLSVTIHNLPHFRVSSKHVAGSMCLTLMLCRCLSRFGPKRGS